MNEVYLSIQNEEIRRHQFSIKRFGLVDLGRTRALVRGLLDLRRTRALVLNSWI